MTKVRYPFGDADVASIEDAATSLITIIGKTLVQAGTISQAITGLSLKAADDLAIGSEVIVDVAQGATGRDVAFGSAGSTIVSPDLTGVANDRDVVVLVWTGTEFLAKTAAWNKVVDAA